MIKMLVATLGMAAVGWLVWTMLARQEAADGEAGDAPAGDDVDRPDD